MSPNSVMLTFDLEEFDMPLEYDYPITFQEQIEVSRKGTQRLLTLLGKYNVSATFFCTVVFARENTDLINQIILSGHELASHSFYHSKFSIEDALKSKDELERISQQTIRGFRMPRMKPIDTNQLQNAGYTYDSSLHPTWIPGRYNNLKQPRTLHKKGKLIELPASVTPKLRIPLFWLSFHHFPKKLYYYLLKRALKHDHYAVLYFHPWEFVDLKEKYGLPYLATKNTGDQMMARFESLIKKLQIDQHQFQTIESFLNQTQRDN